MGVHVHRERPEMMVSLFFEADSLVPLRSPAGPWREGWRPSLPPTEGVHGGSARSSRFDIEIV